MAKRKHDSIDLATKVDILKAVESKLKSNAQLAKDFNVPRSTLQTILKNKEKILEAFKTNKFVENRKRMRLSTWPEVEDALEAWMRNVRDRHVSVSGPILKAKAEEFALRLGHDDFKASDGWLTGFKNRRQIVAKHVNGESASADTEECQVWLENTWPEIIQEYAPENIFNADETGLYWKQIPDRTLAFKDDKAKGEKKDKNRITVLIGGNLTGTEKLPMLVVGKSAKPRCFKGMRSLPVEYEASGKAWVTEAIFRKWVISLDRKFSRQKRKIVLLLDNCTAHGKITGLEAIRLKFLPPNTTSILQPMDQGVIRNLKVRYQKKVVNRILICLDSNQKYEIDLLKAIYMLASSWDEVSENTISGSFRKGKLFHNLSTNEGPSETNQAKDTEREMSDFSEGLEMLKRKGLDVLGGSNVEELFQIDSDLQICEDLTDEGIVSSIMSKRQTEHPETNLENDSEDETENLPAPTINEARGAIELLQRFLSMQEKAHEEIQKLSTIEQFVHNISLTNMKQSKISSFFIRNAKE